MARSVASRAGGGTRLAVAAFIVALLSLALAAVRPPATSAQDPVTTLSGITVNGVAVTDFDPEITAYTVGVANAVATATVVATPTATGAATVACGRDDDGKAEGCQVALTADAGVDLALTVTNGLATRTYTVTINRGLEGTFQWKASDDIYGFTRAVPGDAGFGRGLWADGETIWALNGTDRKLYAFDLQTGARVPGEDLAVTGSSQPLGVTGLAGVLLVSDRRAGMVRGYTRNNQNAWQRDTSWDLSGATPAGLRDIWTDGQILWAVGHRDNPATSSIRAVGLTGTQRNELIAGEHFENLNDAGNRAAVGIWSDGETMWVADELDATIYAYDMVTKNRVTSKEFRRTHLTPGGAAISPWGIWSDGETMWVMDSETENIYSFHMPVSNNADLLDVFVGGQRISGFDPQTLVHSITLPNTPTRPTATFTTRQIGASLVVGTDVDPDTPGAQLDLATSPATVSVVVTAQDGVTTRTYSLTFGRLPPVLAPTTVTPGDRSLAVGWSAPQDVGTSTVTAYDLRYVPTTTEQLYTDSNWTVIEDIWVSGGGDLAYTITQISPVHEYYVQVRAVNGSGDGPWLPHSRILESGKGKPTTSGGSVTTLSALSVSPGELAPEFMTGTDEYTVDLDYDRNPITFTATPTDPAAEVEYRRGNDSLTDRDANTPGHQVSLSDLVTVLTVRVIAENELSHEDYTVTVTRSTPSREARLNSLALQDASGQDLPGTEGDFNRAFHADRDDYAAAVAYGTARVTVAWERRDDTANVAIRKGSDDLPDADNNTSGHQVDLAVGENTVEVLVTAQDGTLKTYTVDITRPKPVVSVSAPEVDAENPLTEGDVGEEYTLRFTISRDAPAPEPLTVEYQITSPSEQRANATILADQQSVIVSVTGAGDATWRAHPTFTLSILSDDEGRYDISQTANTASQTLLDDDFPIASASVSVSAGTVQEGEEVTVTVTVETFDRDQPHGSTGPLRFSTRELPRFNAATIGQDFPAIDERFMLAAGDFARSANGRTFVATWTKAIPIPRDGIAEDEEVFEVRLAKTDQTAPDLLVSSGGARDVRIAPSEAASTDATLSALSAAPATLSPAFPTAVDASYTGAVARNVAQVTLVATPTDGGATVAFLRGRLELMDEDGNDANGFQAALDLGENVFTVRVTAEDGNTTETYTATITRNRSTVATLATLSLSEGTLAPPFPTSTENRYTAGVAGTVERVAIAATATDSENATVHFLPADGDNPLTDGEPGTTEVFDVDLTPGPNRFRVRVTAEDGETMQTYVLTITRESDLPEVRITAPTGTFTEGDLVNFTVSRPGAPAEALVVRLTVSEDGDMVTGSAARVVTIPASGTSATLTVVTRGDMDWENHSQVTVAINANAFYTVSAERGSASVLVHDDDFPLSDAVLSLSPNTVNEGDSVTVTVTVTTQRHEEPHAASGVLSVRSRDGGAVAPGDYGALAETSFSFSTFAEVDLDTNPDDTVTDLRWQASREFTIRTTNELDVEQAEAFTVELSVDSTSANHDKLVPAGSPATVTIRSSDFPEVSVRAPSGTFVEASNVDFTVSLPQATLTDLTVHLAVTEDGEVVDDSLEDDPQTPAVETRAVTIVANTSAATFSLPTEPDTDWEEHSNVTVAVADGTDYSISTNAGSASVAVQDDDLPASTVTLAVSPTTQDEGSSVTATLTLRTRNPGQLPHGGSGPIRMFTATDTADANDFAALDERITFVSFTEEDDNGDVYYTATETRSVFITPDTEPEREERFTVMIEEVTGAGGTHPGVGDLLPSGGSVAVTIRASDLPEVSIASTGSEAVAEGATLEFTVMRDIATTEPLTVTVFVRERDVNRGPSSFVGSADKGSRDVTIAGGAASATVSVPTLQNDTTWEEHGLVTATLVAGDGYLVSATRNSAARSVLDDDFPVATLTIEGIVNPAAEGTSETLTYRFRTADDEQPHKSTGQFALRFETGSATAGTDYTTYEPLILEVAANDFTRVDIDSGPATVWRWEAEGPTARNLVIVEENVEEGEETFSIILEAVGDVDTTSPGDGNITPDSPGVITIPASDQSDASENAYLAGLTLSRGTLDPPFTPRDPNDPGATHTTRYTASVAYSVTQITITPTREDTTATISYPRNRDDDQNFGHQVNLVEGENVIAVAVTAEDTRYFKLYEVTVTRGPRVSIRVANPSAEVIEDGEVGFTVTRSQATAQPLTVSVQLSENGAMLSSTDKTTARTVTIPANATSATLTVRTAGDEEWEAPSTVTATVVADDGYEPHATLASASKTVQDDDLAGATVAIAVSSSEVDEGDSPITVTVTVTTLRDEEPNGGTGPFRLYTEAGSATATDFAALDETISFNQFTGDASLQKWVATTTRTIAITDDALREGSEDFRIRLARRTGTHAALNVPATHVTVTIGASDGEDATLSALALTLEGDRVGYMTPAFDPTRQNQTAYTAAVGYTIKQITVEASATDENAEVTFRGRHADDANDGVDGHQVDLVVGENVINVRVAAQNRAVTKTYTITVTRTEEDLSLTPAASDPQAPYATTVTYDIRFRGRWTTAVTPGSLPGTAHFSTLIGGVHDAGVTFLESGGTASPGIEAMAEIGNTGSLTNEVNAAIGEMTALGVISRSPGSGPTPTADLAGVELTSAFPRVTLTTMIAPSHDWFVGVSGLLLLDDQGRWLRSHDVDLFPWDAGTEAGNDFSFGSPGTETDEPIHSLRGVGRFTTRRIASLHFGLHAVSTVRQLDENTAVVRALGPAVSSPVAPPAGGGTVTYSVAGADAASFAINAGTGQLSTRSGGDYDFERKPSYALTVVATDTGPDPHVVTNIEVEVAIQNLEEPGEVSVVPSSALVGALMRASLSDPDGGVIAQSWTWERSDDNSVWTAITGATSATYRPADGDVDKYLRVTVSYEDALGAGKSATAALGQVEQRVLSTDNTLSALSLSGVTLGPEFSTTVQNTNPFTASVAYTLTQFTLTATKNHEGAAVQILDGSGSDAKPIPDADDDENDGHQVALVPGSNTIVVRVTAESGTSRDFAITVTREKPAVSITGPASAVAEGMNMEFVVSRPEAAADTLTVEVAVVEEGGDLVAGTNQKTHDVTIPGGETEATLAIPLVDDLIWEEHAQVTATIESSTTSPYTIMSGAGSASATGEDDDFPAATAVLSVEPLVDGVPRVEEEATATVTVTITTNDEEEPHTGSGAIQLSTANGTALAGQDYTAISGPVGELEFVFTHQDIGNGVMRYRASESVTITTLHDTTAEGDETFTVSMAKVPAGEKETNAAITLDPGTRSVSVTISASDQSGVSTLSSLTLTAGTVDVPLSRPFTREHEMYGATVDFGVERITVTPTRDDQANASYEFYDDGIAEDEMALGDASTEPGFQVALSVGDTTFKVRVTAQDGTETTYIITVTRNKPVLSVELLGEDVKSFEGAPVFFVVRRNGTVSEPTTVTVMIGETPADPNIPADLVLVEAEIGLILTFEGGETEHQIAVATFDDDRWEGHSTVTLTILKQEDLIIEEGKGEAAHFVHDDEFPSAQAVLTVSPSPVSEETDRVVVATLTIRTDEDQQPHKSSGRIQLGTADGSAHAGQDYTALTQSEGVLILLEEAFIRDDSDPADIHYRASGSVNIPILNDNEKEQDERFTVSMAAVTTGVARTDSAITLATSPTEVVISRSDLSSDNSLDRLVLTAGGEDVDATFTPGFVPGITTYTVDVPFGHPRIILLAEPTSSDVLSVEVLDNQDLPLDDDTSTAGVIEVDLAVGAAREVQVKVTAEDGGVRLYTFTFTRQQPVLTISVADGDLEEGKVAESEPVVFTITRNGRVLETTPLQLTVGESGTMVDEALQVTNETYIIQANTDSFELSLPTQPDDVWEQDSTVSAQIQSGAYTISGPATATKVVVDDDFPVANAVLSIDPPDGMVDEGDDVTVTVTITTEEAQEPHEDGGAIRLSTADGTAQAGSDYTAITTADGKLTFERDDFEEIGGGDQRYRATKQVVVATANDGAPEGAETFSVAMADVSADQNVTLQAPTSLTLTFAASDLGDNAELQNLEVTAGTFSADLAADTLDHAVDVPFPRSRVTVAPERRDELASHAFFQADGTTELEDANNNPSDGFQVDLPTVGTGVVVKIKVTSADESTDTTYTLTITRQDPAASITVADPGLEVAEGGEVAFTVELDGPVEDAAGVTVNVSVSGPMVATASLGFQAVQIARGAQEAALTVMTEGDDEWEDHAEVTATLETGTGYTVTLDEVAASASHTVLDDDFPQAEAVLTVSPNPVDEGGTATVVVTVTTEAEHEPHKAAGSILVSTADGTAVDGFDYTAIPALEQLLTFPALARVDVDDDPNTATYAYRATVSATVPITEDTEEEEPETLTVSMAGVTAGPSQTDGAITLDPATTSVTLTINANDEHVVTGIGVDPRVDGATVTVSIDNPSESEEDVYLRYKPITENAWKGPEPMLTSGTEVEFPLQLTAGTDYDIEASLDDSFPQDKTVARTFSTLGTAPVVSRVEFENVTQTSATARVLIANSDGTTEQTVLLRYQADGEASWTDPDPPSRPTTGASVTFDLTGLASGTEHHVQATIKGDFDSGGVQSADLTTLPPAVTAVAVEDPNKDPLTATEATISVTVAAPNGDHVYLRYRRRGGATLQPPSQSVAVGEAGTTFDISELLPGETYDVEASYGSTFADRDAVRCVTFVTDSAPDQDDGRSTGTTCRGSNTPPPSSVIGGTGIFVGGGGGGGGPSPSTVDFEWTVKHDIETLDSGHEKPTGSWSDGVTFWIVDNGSGADDEVYAYSLITGERVEASEFALDESNRAPRGIWSDGETVWVSDSGRDRVFVYDLTSGERLEGREIELDEANRDARGIWSDGVVLWVLDDRANALFAYDLASGRLLAHYSLHSANTDPRDVSSDGVTIWVSDDRAKRLFAYRLPSPSLAQAGTVTAAQAGDESPQPLERVNDEEFTHLSRASNNSPRGIWSDGDVMYVVDASDDKVYSYNMPDAIDARLATLSLSGVEIGEFDPNRTDYEGLIAEGVSESVVTAEAMQRRTDVVVDPPDADVDTDGHQVALQDISEVTVTVTSADGSRKKVYRVHLDDPAPEPWPHCLLGDVATGFSLVVYEGGSVEELVACAQSRSLVALYALHDGAYVSYIVEAPAFVNRSFVELYGDGLPAFTPLVAGSGGPASADPASGGGVAQSWPECLHGEVVEGFSLVLYEGGSVEDLEACAGGMGVTALYALHDGAYVSYILGAPAFVNQSFSELYAEGVPAVTPLVVKSDGQLRGYTVLAG